MIGLAQVQRLEEAHVATQESQVADGEVGRDGDCRCVVQQLNPADDEPNRRVERSSGKAGAASGMR